MQRPWLRRLCICEINFFKIFPRTNRPLGCWARSWGRGIIFVWLMNGRAGTATAKSPMNQ